MANEKCNQKDCQEPAAYRFTCPGRDEAICDQHVNKLRNVAAAIGLHLQVVSLAPEADHDRDS